MTINTYIWAQMVPPTFLQVAKDTLSCPKATRPMKKKKEGTLIMSDILVIEQLSASPANA